MTAPWMEPLDDETREAVKTLVAQSPPLTEEQRHRVRLLFRNGAA